MKKVPWSELSEEDKQQWRDAYAAKMFWDKFMSELPAKLVAASERNLKCPANMGLDTFRFNKNARKLIS